jgi:hypothetical protein
MQPSGEPFIGTLDVSRGCAAVDTQDNVEIHVDVRSLISDR